MLPATDEDRGEPRSSMGMVAPSNKITPALQGRSIVG